MNLTPLKSHMQAPQVGMVESEDGTPILIVPNHRVARLIQLGIGVERAQERRRQERKAAKASRKKNRGANRGR